MASSDFSTAAVAASPRRKRHRRPARTNRVFAWFALALCLASFGGGFVWKKLESRNSGARPDAADDPPDPAARAEALREVDEALRARQEKRISGALAALDRARRADPSLPGLQIAFAEIAFNEGEFSELRKAAAAVRNDVTQSAAASVLLGVEKWLSRGGSDREMMSAADSASAQFAEATEADFFAPAAWYFQSDVLRYAGREQEGRTSAFGALLRYHPWDSPDIIAAKVIFASAEAGDTVFGTLAFLPDSPWVEAVIDSVGRQDASLSGFGAQVAAQQLSRDPSFHARAETTSAARTGLPVLP